MATKEEVKGLLRDLPFQVIGSCIFFMQAGKMIDLTQVQKIEYDRPDFDEDDEDDNGYNWVTISFNREEEQSDISIEYPLTKSGKFDEEMRELFKAFAASRKYVVPKQKVPAQ